MIAEVPALRDDEGTGLLVVDWPAGRRREFVMPPAIFEALIVIVNAERERARAIAVEALTLCDQWDANDITGNQTVTRLRKIIEAGS